MHDKPARGLVRPRQKATRVGYFTDAVFAIDLTVLAIELPRPEGSSFVPGHGISKAQAFCRLWQFMVGQRDQYYAYLDPPGVSGGPQTWKDEGPWRHSGNTRKSCGNAR
jgi:hypothetical protein